MKNLFILLGTLMLCASVGFSQDGTSQAVAPDLLQKIVMQTEEQSEESGLSLKEKILRAVKEADMETLDLLKYQAAADLPEVRDEQGNNVFHLAKDENVVQAIAFALRNADAKTGGALKIKALLEEKNKDGQTPVFKSLADGKAEVYRMYSAFIELPKLLKKANACEEAERAEILSKIQAHIQDSKARSLLDVAKEALAKIQAQEEVNQEQESALQKEIKSLSEYERIFFF